MIPKLKHIFLFLITDAKLFIAFNLTHAMKLSLNLKRLFKGLASNDAK